jgi:exopolysaccharide biosynthesis polyprenyl glycosylphosphotransferase
MTNFYSLLTRQNYSYAKDKSDNLKVVIDLIEIVLVLLSIPLSYYLTRSILLSYDYTWKISIPQMTLFGILILISWFVLSNVTSMSQLPRAKRYFTLLSHYVRVHLVIMVILLMLKFIFNFYAIPVVFILLIVPINMFLTFTLRIVANRQLRIFRAKGYELRHVMVVADASSTHIIDLINNQKDWGYKIVCVVTKSKVLKGMYGEYIDFIRDNDEIKDYLDNNIIDEVLYVKNSINHNELTKIIDICNEVGVVFRIQSCVMDSNMLQFKTYSDASLTLVDVPSGRLPVMLKNMVDIYFAITAVVLLSPVFILIAMLIKLESKGPVFFKQERIGLRGRKFNLYKFRTMVVNAEELLENLRAKNESDGPTFKIKDDPRVTKLGRFMRKTGLDELPQFFNVISGEMSMIGPRPPLESEVKQYKRWQLRRLSVKPGITCTWQISPNRNDVKFEKWMQLDLHYIDNWSLAKDAELFFRTIKTFFMANGR